MEKIFVTLEKYKLLRQEIKDLKTKERRKIADKLSEYRDTSDLLEDSSYTEVLQEQANLEEKIDEIENVLENATIIKQRKTVKANLGSMVIMTDVKSRRKLTISIVGSVDANPLKKEISNESPLGQSLLGKKKGDIIEVTTPSGHIKYKILEIK